MHYLKITPDLCLDEKCILENTNGNTSHETKDLLNYKGCIAIVDVLGNTKTFYCHVQICLCLFTVLTDCCSILVSYHGYQNVTVNDNKVSINDVTNLESFNCNH